MSAERRRSSDHVQSLERGLAVIRAFDGDHRELSLSDVARGSGVSRAAARRFLHTLVTLGYVQFDGRLFALRPRVLELGHAYLSGLSFADVARPPMEALVAAVRESCSIAVLDDVDVVYVVRVPARRIMAVTIAVGTHFPAYATSMGRVLLAALPPPELDARLRRVEVRALTARTVTDVDALRRELAQTSKRGYAVVDQELEEGVRSAAVPIHGAGGAVMAAINVSAHASRTSTAELRRALVPRLRETAAAIEADLLSIGDSGTRAGIDLMA